MGYVYAALLLAGLFTGSVGAWKVQSWRYGALLHERDVAAQRDTMKRIDRIDEAATSHEDFKAKEDIRYVERIKVVREIVERPVYRNTCVDPDGLRLINSAIRGEDPGQPAPAVPGPARTP